MLEKSDASRFLALARHTALFLFAAMVAASAAQSKTDTPPQRPETAQMGGGKILPVSPDGILTQPRILSRGTERRLQADTGFLASDHLAGRDPGTPGYDIAAAYVAAQFQAAGLTPVDGSFLQQVPLRRRSLERNGVQLRLVMHGRAKEYENGVDVAVDASPYSTTENLRADLVFVGWGISAPGMGLDDYRGLDVRGKAVVLLEGAPPSLPGPVRAHLAWIQQKERMAAAHGAVAMLTLKTPERERVYSFDLARKLRLRPGVTSDPDPSVSSNRVRAIVTLGPRAASDLFASANKDIAAIYASAPTAPPRGFALPASLELSRLSRHESLQSANVVGMLEGSDPKLRDQVIMVLAHLDHLGLGPAVNGDKIYNGAVDNAGGVAVMLEMARALTAGPRPRRSILFVATTAEEKGLVGSEYLAAHPVVPNDRIVAAVSVDGLMAFNDFTGVVALGAELSSLGTASEKAAASVGAAHVPDPIPERGNIALSDQYPFLRMGIPVLFPNPARETSRPDPAGVAAWDAYDNGHYHQPSDDLSLPLRWDSAARWSDYLQRTVANAANQTGPIAWKDRDPAAVFFANERKSQRHALR